MTTEEVLCTATVNGHQHTILIPPMPEDDRELLLKYITYNLEVAFGNGKKQARSEIQAAIRTALTF